MYSLEKRWRSSSSNYPTIEYPELLRSLTFFHALCCSSKIGELQAVQFSKDSLTKEKLWETELLQLRLWLGPASAGRKS